MRNNKILAAAIASALSLGAGTVYAAPELTLLHPAPTVDGTAGDGDADIGFDSVAGEEVKATAATYAAELFAGNAVAIPTDGGPDADGDTVLFDGDDTFIVRLKLNISDALASASYISILATLSTGTWADDLLPTQLKYCSSAYVVGMVANMDTNCNDLHSFTPVAVSKGVLPSKESDSTADFVIQRTDNTKEFNTSDWVFFAFDVDDLGAFQNTNGVLRLTMEASVVSLGAPIPLGTATIDLAKSDSALQVAITPNREPQLIAVDVAQNYLKFVKGTTTTQVVSLGDVVMQPKDGVRDYNGSNDYPIGAVPKKGTLTVTNGIFSASKGTNAVFLDLNNNNTFDEGTDIAAVVKDDTTAVWELEDPADDLVQNLIDAAKQPPRIVVVVDGTTPIATLSEAPRALLEIFFDDSATPKRYTGKLRHIKDNGTKCTLYNIPDGTAGLGSLDGVSVRITNKSKDRTGTIFGELYDEKGVNLYGSRKTLATIEPMATIRLNTGEGGDLDLTYGQYHWAGQRARLVITSDLQDIEMFGLVRNTQGGPNMNVSTGATGNGCIE